MPGNNFTVASASQLRGSKSWDDISERLNGSTGLSLSAPRDRSPITGLGAQVGPTRMPQLLPVCYAPPDRSEGSKGTTASSRRDSISSSAETEAPEGRPAIDTDARHKPQWSDSSTSSNYRRRGRKDAIYFTPTDVTRSQIFLSSPDSTPVGSPTLPKDDERSGSNEDDEESTPRTSVSQPSCEIYTAPLQLRPPQKRDQISNKLTIKPEQLDRLVTALVKCRLVQRDVRKHWWDDEDIRDDESVSTMTSVSTPTLSSASALYSQPNEVFLKSGVSLNVRKAMEDSGLLNSLGGSSQAKRLPAAADDPFGGVALADPTVHGSPIRYVSTPYRVGNHILPAGACSFVTVPYGVDVECNLRIEPVSAFNPSIRVLLRCINQVVDRKSGRKASLLVAEVDVTSPFHRAALAELRHISPLDVSEISIAPSPIGPTASPDIDWIALADDLHANALARDTVDTALRQTALLTAANCTMSTLALLSELSRIRDAHRDFFVLRPVAWHDNGVPSGMRLPWVSARLWADWYAGDARVGRSRAARDFQAGMAAEVARRVAAGQGEGQFVCRVDWEGEGVVIKGVALGETRGKVDLWVCFVHGMFELDAAG